MGWQLGSVMLVQMRSQKEIEAGKQPFVIIDGVHRYLALGNLIEMQRSPYDLNMTVPCLVLKPETPYEVVVSQAMVANQTNEVYAGMTWLDEIVAALRVATSLEDSRKCATWDMLTCTSLSKVHEEELAVQPFNAIKLPKTWGNARVNHEKRRGIPSQRRNPMVKIRHPADCYDGDAVVPRVRCGLQGNFICSLSRRSWCS